MDKPVKPSYEFGSYRLDPGNRALMRGQERQDLPPRVFDTLLALVRESGQLLEKDRLMRTVWPDTVVEENNLSQAVYLLRKILRDGEGGTRFIETVPKRGYRFVARVRILEPEAEAGIDDGAAERGQGSPHTTSVAASWSSKNYKSAPSLGSTPSIEASTAAAKNGRGISGSRWMLGLVAILLALFVVLVVQLARWRDHRGNRVLSEPIRSIAILPLQNLSSDPEQEYFADGMTDELITDLAQVRELRVVSKTSTMQYKGAHLPLPQIGRELGVDAVVEGSVLRSGNRVRITAQLIQTATDRHLWAKAYEGEVRDVLSLQALVAEAITDEVKLSLTTAERNRLHNSRPVNPEAYEAYLRGRYAWNRRDVEGFQKGIEYFNQAIGRDPNFALAYSGLADSYTLMALNTLGPGLMAEAQAASWKALALDDGLAEAHTSLGAVKIFLDWDWAGAESEFKRALELNPNYAPAHHWYGNILLGPLGRHEEAMAELKRAKSLDPLSLIINTDIGYADYLARRYDAAFSQYQKVLAMDRSFVPVHNDLLRYYAQKGMGDDWLREELADSRLSGHPERAQSIQHLYANGGFRRVMWEMAVSRGTFESGGRTAHQGSFCTAAESYAALGSRQSALAALEQCYKAREPGLLYLKVDPAWDSLRSEPVFQKVAHRIGLQ